jgi:hypothetical protein
MGGGGTNTGGGQSYTTALNWKDFLPSWTQSGQQAALPWLMQRAQQGLLPSESNALWGGIQGQLDTSSASAGKGLASKLASSGISTDSPAAAGGFADLAADRVSAGSKAALDFAKMKIGAKETAIGQMLTALYTPPPVATASSSYTNPSSSSGGK